MTVLQGKNNSCTRKRTILLDMYTPEKDQVSAFSPITPKHGGQNYKANKENLS